MRAYTLTVVTLTWRACCDLRLLRPLPLVPPGLDLDSRDGHRGSVVSAPGLSPVGQWTCAGLLWGGALGGGYGFLLAAGVGLASGSPLGGLTVGLLAALIGGIIGLMAGSLIGFLIGLAQLLLRRTAIPVPAIAVMVTELILLPLQLLAARDNWQAGPAVFIYLPSMLGLGAATVLGGRLPPAKRPDGGPESPEPVLSS